MLTDFDFERADALPHDDGPGARAYIARVAEEDGAALVAHVARIRRGVSQLCAECFFDLTASLRAVNPAAAAEVCAELEALIIGSQRLGSAAHALDVAATRAHWAAYECAPNAPTQPAREAAPAPTRAPDAAEMDDDWQPELAKGESARDEDARDIGQDLPAYPPASVPGSARVAVVPDVAQMPKIPVTDESNRQRKQFWAVVNKAGLSSHADQRAARLKAIGARLGREVVSINTLTHDEWQNVISGVEYQSLVW